MLASEKLGELVRQHRKWRGLTQASVARKIGELPSNMSAFEVGRRSLSTERLDKLFALLTEPHSLMWYELYAAATEQPPMMRDKLSARELKAMCDELVRYRYTVRRMRGGPVT